MVEGKSGCEPTPRRLIAAGCVRTRLSRAVTSRIQLALIWGTEGGGFVVLGG